MHVGELIVEQRIHNQVTSGTMKFLSLADWTGIVETELFAKIYRTYGLATVRYPVLEIESRVEPFENGSGFTLQAMAARRPRRKTKNVRGDWRVAKQVSRTVEVLRLEAAQNWLSLNYHRDGSALYNR